MCTGYPMNAILLDLVVLFHSQIPVGFQEYRYRSMVILHKDIQLQIPKRTVPYFQERTANSHVYMFERTAYSHVYMFESREMLTSLLVLEWAGLQQGRSIATLGPLTLTYPLWPPPLEQKGWLMAKPLIAPFDSWSFIWGPSDFPLGEARETVH